MRLTFALLIAVAVAVVPACQRADKAADEHMSDPMMTSGDSGMMSDSMHMMSDTMHMMAGDTAQRM
jgi:hypothetical protein